MKKAWHIFLTRICRLKKKMIWTKKFQMGSFISFNYFNIIDIPELEARFNRKIPQKRKFHARFYGRI